MNQSENFWGTIPNFNQPGARKQNFFVSDLIKFGTLPQKYRTQCLYKKVYSYFLVEQGVGSYLKGYLFILFLRLGFA